MMKSKFLEDLRDYVVEATDSGKSVEVCGK
jgi:hypothetical protein